MTTGAKYPHLFHRGRMVQRVYHKTTAFQEVRHEPQQVLVVIHQQYSGHVDVCKIQGFHLFHPQCATKRRAAEDFFDEHPFLHAVRRKNSS
jgi:hypothetical protein